MSFKQEVISLMKKYGIIKSDKPEEMVSYEVVYEPNEIDSHGQWMSEDTVRKACENFNTNLEKGVVVPNLFHLAETELFSIEKTWINEELDVVVPQTDQPIKAGTWIAKIQYHDSDLWELKKSGVIQGVSIGGKGILNEETGELTEITFDGETNASSD